MSTLTTKFLRAKRKPERVPHYIKSNLLMSSRFLRQGKPHYLLASAIAGVTGWNPYASYLKRRSTDGTAIVNVHGNEMYVNLDDRGISRELLMYRTRESQTTEAFRNQLRWLRERTDTPVVLEAGANIGYYALQEADLLGPDATILAFEPGPRNFETLRRNVEHNGYEDQFRLENKALGAEPGTAHLEISEQSKQNQIVDAGHDRSVEVEIDTVDQYLDSQGIDPAEIAVFRMDVQGFEGDILRRMEDILTADSPQVGFVEFHPWNVDEDHLEWFISLAEDRYEIVSAHTADGVQAWYEYPVSVDEFADLWDLPSSTGVIMRRNPAKQ